MAKAKTVGEAMDELFKDYKKAIEIAAKEATTKAKNDIYKKVISCLINYYDDYNPSSYNRSYRLKDSFVPYESVKEKSDHFECTAGIEFDLSKIENQYYGSKQYSPTDVDWIFENFWNGIHPRTDGSRDIGGGDYDNQKYQGSFVPGIEIQKYIKNYEKIFDQNIKLSLMSQGFRLMK